MRGVRAFDERARDYDRWFDDNDGVYQAEVDAVRALLPDQGIGLEVGVGTGRFAAPLEVAFGIDPARGALEIALARGVHVCLGFGERLPFPNRWFDFVLLITVDPFVPHLAPLLEETQRVLKPGGSLIVGMIDRDSLLGQMYEEHKNADPFYRHARFRSAEEMINHLRQAGLKRIVARQTLSGPAIEAVSTDQIQGGFDAESLALREGFGSGAFVVLRAVKTTP